MHIPVRSRAIVESGSGDLAHFLLSCAHSDLWTNYCRVSSSPAAPGGRVSYTVEMRPTGYVVYRIAVLKIIGRGQVILGF